MWREKKEREGRGPGDSEALLVIGPLLETAVKRIYLQVLKSYDDMAMISDNKIAIMLNEKIAIA